MLRLTAYVLQQLPKWLIWLLWVQPTLLRCGRLHLRLDDKTSDWRVMRGFACGSGGNSRAYPYGKCLTYHLLSFRYSRNRVVLSGQGKSCFSEGRRSSLLASSSLCRKQKGIGIGYHCPRSTTAPDLEIEKATATGVTPPCFSLSV